MTEEVLRSGIALRIVHRHIVDIEVILLRPFVDEVFGQTVGKSITLSLEQEGGPWNTKPMNSTIVTLTENPMITIMVKMERGYQSLAP